LRIIEDYIREKHPVSIYIEKVLTFSVLSGKVKGPKKGTHPSGDSLGGVGVIKVNNS